MYKHLQERYAPRPPVSIATLERMKAEGEKIAAITAYDASFATLVDDAGVDLVLVGDSLGMVIQGHDTTVPVTLQDVIYHCRAVAKGLYRPFLMADMPFMTYASREQALENAVRLMQEGGAKMVKLEGGGGQVEIVEFLAEPRHRCVRASRAEAAVGAQGRRLSRAGSRRSGGRADVARREGAGSSGRGHRSARMHPGASSARASRRNCMCPSSASAQGRILTARFSCCTTCSTSPRGASRNSRRTSWPGNDSALDAVKAYTEAVKSKTYPAPEHCF